jgi:hypothetical protein
LSHLKGALLAQQTALEAYHLVQTASPTVRLTNSYIAGGNHMNKIATGLIISLALAASVPAMAADPAAPADTAKPAKKARPPVPAENPITKSYKDESAAPKVDKVKKTKKPPVEKTVKTTE